MAAQQKEKQENSYVLAPDYKMKFRSQQVHAIMKDVMTTKLEGVVYHAEGSNLLAKQLADEIKARLKDEASIDPRYKIISQVSIVEQRGQGLRIGHRAFWDEDTDGFATESFSNDHLFAVATAYAVYYY